MASWEKLNEDKDGTKTDRLKVPGGWLYRTRTFFTKGSTPALAFVPDLTEVPPPPARKPRAKKAAPPVPEEYDDGRPVDWNPKQ